MVGGAIPIILAIIIVIPLITAPEIAKTAIDPLDESEIEFITHQLRNTSPGMTNMDTVVNMASPSSSRNYLFGFGISSGSYNASSSLASNATLFDTNFGETFAIASFAPTKFSEN